MVIEVFRVSAFTSDPFAGNPAVVCLLGAPANDDWMQAFAREMNVSETAFVHAEGDDYRLRWFSPTTEVRLCGHGTLATTHVLREAGRLPDGGTARYHTLSGVLTGTCLDGLRWLDFPARIAAPTTPPAGLTDALGAAPVFVGQSEEDLLVEVADAATVRALAPDMDRLATIEARGVAVTARADAPGADFVSRFFAPRTGIAEDPVTGSSHCTLAPYWAERLGKQAMVGYQVSPRGGEVRVELQGDRVLLGGAAVTVFRGELG